MKNINNIILKSTKDINFKIARLIGNIYPNIGRNSREMTSQELSWVVLNLINVNNEVTFYN